MFNNSKAHQEKVARLPNPRHDQVNGLLDKGCSFEGKLTFDGTVQINGDFSGEIFSDGTLVVGTEACVRAKVFVDTLIAYGRIEGQIEAKSRIEMHVPAMITADLKTKHLSVEDGVIFQGVCHMERQSEQVNTPRELPIESPKGSLSSSLSSSLEAEPRLQRFSSGDDDESVLVG